MRKLFTLLLGLLTSSVFAQINITSNTVWDAGSVPPLPINDDIIIHSGAYLSIETDVEMANSRSITIKDGGKLYGNQGSLTGTGNPSTYTWEGITVEPTGAGNNNAAAMEAIKILGDFRIEDARFAIFTYGGTGLKHRNFEIRNTIFAGNGMHLYFDDNTVGTAQLTRFINCEFMQALEYWPILMHRPNNMSFWNCVFDYNSAGTQLAQRATHMDQANNVTFDGCKVYDTGSYGFCFHFNGQGIKIRNNSFFTVDPFPSSGIADYAHISVELGVEFPGPFTDIEVTDNYFEFHDQGNNEGIAAIVGKVSSFDNLFIAGNYVKDYGIGVDVDNASMNVNTIEENYFTGYDDAFISRANNSKLRLSCNTFEAGDRAMWVRSGSLQNHYNPDPSNQFIANPIDIQNDNLPFFYYAVHSNSPNPPVATAGFTFLTGATARAKCLGREDGDGQGGGPSEKSLIVSEAGAATLNLLPNPSQGQVTLSVLNMGDQAQYQLLDLSGKVMAEGSLVSASSYRLDFSDLPGGVYLMQVQNGTKVLTEKLVITK